MSGAIGTPRGSPIKRLGVLTSGGDAPGLNAVIRAVVKSAAHHRIECVGLEDSFDGLLEVDRSRILEPKNVTGILRLGGTILGTQNSRNSFAYPIATSNGLKDYSARVVEIFDRMGFDALIAVGGDGTLAFAHQFCQRGLPIVCVPNTIDNDIVGTTSSFGFDTAVAYGTEAIDRLHTTAEAHKRILVVEVMGRYAGWIALRRKGGGGRHSDSGIPFDLSVVAERVRERDRWGASLMSSWLKAPFQRKRSLPSRARRLERFGGGVQV
jgi:6-phosphofructokinase 1